MKPASSTKNSAASGTTSGTHRMAFLVSASRLERFSICCPSIEARGCATAEAPNSLSDAQTLGGSAGHIHLAMRTAKDVKVREALA
jgi:hypothetical protein